MSVPEPGIVTKADVTRVIDADTIEVEITRTFNVRVRDFLAAEKNTDKGKVAKQFLDDVIHHEENNSEVTVFIPSNNPHKLMDINSFNRLIGDIWLADGTNLVDLMEAHGMGRKLKKGEKPHEGE